MTRNFGYQLYLPCACIAIIYCFYCFIQLILLQIQSPFTLPTDLHSFCISMLPSGIIFHLPEEHSLQCLQRGSAGDEFSQVFVCLKMSIIYFICALYNFLGWQLFSRSTCKIPFHCPLISISSAKEIVSYSSEGNVSFSSFG